MKKKLLILLFQVTAALAVGILLVLIAGRSPIAAGHQFVYGIFGSLNGFAEVMVKATPLIFLGLGISVAFSTGFFNIGAEGQLYMGALVSTMVAVWLPLPGIARIIIAIVLSFAMGALWAFVPALLKNTMGISETVNTIMFNYIAIMIVGIMIRGVLRDPATFYAQSAMIDESASLPIILPPTRLHLGFIIAVVCAVVMWFVMEHTIWGFELQMCGLNRRAAYCAGLPVVRSMLLSAVISGGLAGLAGMGELLGVQHRLLEGMSGGNGYTAILIVLLARNHPLLVVIVSLLFAALQIGANTMQRQMAIPAAIVSILTGFIVLMILSNKFLDIYKEHRANKVKGGQ